MTSVILTLHTLVVLALIVMVLLQRSDGGALGIGGGAGGGFMSGRSAANALTRTTSILAAIFFATSLGLAIIAGSGESEESVIQELTGETTPDENAPPAGVSTDDLLNTLGSEPDGASGGSEDAPGAAGDILNALGAEIADQDGAAAPDDAPAPAASQSSDKEDDAPDEE